MTTWAAADVARFARQAGWQGGKLTVAVAVALVASDGDDHAHMTTGLPGGAEFCGLWLARRSLTPDLPPSALYDPRTAASAAYGLTGPSHDDWAWNEVWRAGTWAHRLADADAAIAGRDPDGTRPGVTATADLSAAARRLASTARETVETLIGISRFARSNHPTKE